MTTLEFVVVAACLAIGYKYTSALLGKRDEPAPDDRPLDTTPLFERPLPWHEVLGVLPEATHEEIVAAYRTRMSQYHPDKVANMGEDIRALAERRAKEINAAYAEACAVRPA
ncbi:J domain-containing protein [Luteibacter sp. E-22]|uniref:J domain-containing protein n=1 Tax=Luteibacter sp. E-22 TaxID=3404050 RepID=UPI003CF1CAF4